MHEDFGRIETMVGASRLGAGGWDGKENVDVKRRDLVQRRQILKDSQFRLKLLEIRGFEIKLVG